MKKIFLLLSIIVLSTQGVFAAPQMRHPNNGHKAPSHAIKHHPPKYHPPKHHHRPYYRYRYSCNCHNIHCIHQRYGGAYFRIAPGISIKVSI